MCTVTYIPAGNKTFITHNRDEKSSRSKGFPPKEYVSNGYKLLFPRDTHAGGTWIAANENGNAAVLLNGGFAKHEHTPPYKKSRGLVFLDIIATDDSYVSYYNMDLISIEPFTVILWNNGHLYECRWDGKQKHFKELDAAQRYKWSSVTLYDAEVITRRKNWFEAWQLKHAQPGMDEIMQFHLFAGDGDIHNDLRMDRNGIMLTVSITAIEITSDKCRIKYLDLQDNTSYLEELIFTKARVLK
jgi:Transport and Golgi organisation 2